LFLLVLSFLVSVVRASAFEVQSRAQIEDYIIYIAHHEGVSVSLALEIARHESNFVANAKNPKGSASGVYQFLDSTFSHYCIKKYGRAQSLEEKNDPKVQISCAIAMLREPGGHRHWDESKRGWGYTLSLLQS